jgi:hypothetical protein
VTNCSMPRWPATARRVGHPARDRAGRLRCRQAIARPVYADNAKPCGSSTRSQVRRLHSATRTTVAPQHRSSRRTAVVDKSHGTAAGQQNRLILHTLLPSIRRVQIAQFGTQSRQSSRRPSCRAERRLRALRPRRGMTTEGDSVRRARVAVSLPNIRLSCGWDARRGAGTDLPIKRVIAGWPPR